MSVTNGLDSFESDLRSALTVMPNALARLEVLGDARVRVREITTEIRTLVGREIRAARDAGDEWADIGSALGITPQRAIQLADPTRLTKEATP